MTATDLLVLQLADSAFPSGGFAHSAGLEAAWQQGCVRGAAALAEFIEATLAQAGRMWLPFVAAACRRPEDLAKLDREAEALLSNHVANRASRAQGRAFLLAAERAFTRQSLTAISSELREQSHCGHLAVVFGASCGCLGLPPDRAAGLFLFQTLRGLVSAAVRLGIVGPMEGQSIQHSLSPRAAQIATQAADLCIEDAVQTAPMIELSADAPGPALLAAVSVVTVVQKSEVIT